jgi:ABC-type transport system substrate-binding protein
MVMAEDMFLMPLLYLPLLDVTNGVRLIPCAAASWNSSPDQRIHTFHLRPDMAFANGRPVTSADYVYSLERILTPSTAAPLANYLAGLKGIADFQAGKASHVAGIRAPGPLELVIELESGDPMFGYRMTLSIGCAVPREEVERKRLPFGNMPVGAGPYRIQSWRRGQHLKLERNPYYHGPTPQLLDGVDYMIGGDDALHLMMFERGELDLANIVHVGIPLPSFRRVSADPRWKGLIDLGQLYGTAFLTLNNEIPPFDNVLVRRAVNHAIDRDRRLHVDLGYQRHAEGPIPTGMPAADPTLKGYAYDPPRARQLLLQSGLSLPLRTALWHPLGEEARLAAQGFQWDLKQVGIEVDLKEVTSAQMWSASVTRGQVPIAYTGWIAGIPDPVDILGMTLDGSTLHDVSHNNQAFYNNPSVNRLLHAAAASISLPERRQLYREAERLIVADAPWVVLGHPNVYALRQPWVRGQLLEPLAIYRFDRLSIER